MDDQPTTNAPTAPVDKPVADAPVDKPVADAPASDSPEPAAPVTPAEPVVQGPSGDGGDSTGEKNSQPSDVQATEETAV